MNPGKVQYYDRQQEEKWKLITKGIFFIESARTLWINLTRTDTAFSCFINLINEYMWTYPLWNGPYDRMMY